MNSSDIVGILGIGISIFGILLSIYLARRKKEEFVLICNDPIAIFTDLVEKKEDFTISYKSRPIQEGVYIVRFTLFNRSQRDFGSESIHLPLTIKFSDKILCIESKILLSPTNSVFNITHSDSRLTINWDLFRKKEIVSFEVMLQTSRVAVDSKEIIDKNSLLFRITELDEIQIYTDEYLTEGYFTLFPGIGFSVWTAILGLFLIFFYWLAQIDMIRSDTIYYKVMNKDKSISSVSIWRKHSDVYKFSYEDGTTTYDKLENYFEDRVVTGLEFRKNEGIIFWFTPLILSLAFATFAMTGLGFVVKTIRKRKFKKIGLIPKTFA
ncbi:hypothetical protein CH371_19925 [Leptospira wolffii]|uniref:Uncharacterized protein n=1 Tax=Leptospira wolffii TaxID=409998 RepID=A0A2M9Z6M8_9LEPT|nr:hypothetical protein [Leptospira wolffii]PJZ64093.1 hypothetical protein CH371_19925 [Leptospira wolffii]